MAKLHMICGLPCSGKTTYARKLEKELPALRFSPDEWLEPFVGAKDWDKDLETFGKQRLKIEAMLLDFALRAVNQGVNAILENGFWAKEERDEYRAKAAERGVEVELHYMDVPHDELLSRLKKRNAELPPGTFHIDESKLVGWFKTFEPPDADELGRPKESSLKLPEAVQRRVLLEGPEGAKWVAGLPALVAELESTWKLSVGSVMKGGSAGLVVNAQTADGRAVVLKVPPPWTDPTCRTINILNAANGRGYVRLINEDEKSGAMLLERLGAPLSSLGLSVNAQIETICETLLEAWFKPADSMLFTSGDKKASELATFIEDTWNKLDKPCSRRVIDKALAYAQLRKEAFDPNSAVLAHGDAHASNLLEAQKERQNGSGFKFVDPEGLFIEPAYDLSAIMRDWGAELLQGDPLDLGRRRCELVARLTHLDPEPIWQWGFIERVSTGLHLLELGWEAQGKEFLAVAEAWALDLKSNCEPNSSGSVKNRNSRTRSHKI